MKLHGGSITAESVVGQGTTFTVSIPLGSAHLPTNLVRSGRTQTAKATGAIAYVEEALRWLPNNRQAQEDGGSDIPPISKTVPFRITGKRRMKPRTVLVCWWLGAGERQAEGAGGGIRSSPDKAGRARCSEQVAGPDCSVVVVPCALKSESPRTRPPHLIRADQWRRVAAISLTSVIRHTLLNLLTKASETG